MPDSKKKSDKPKKLEKKESPSVEAPPEDQKAPNKLKEFFKDEKNRILFFTGLSIFALAIISIVIVAVKVKQDKKEEQKIVEIIPTPTPTPIPKPIPSGRQVYVLSHGPSVEGPKIQEVIIDPLDPDKDEIQLVKMSISHDKPVKFVEVHVITDNDEEIHEMELTEGDDLNGMWEASWTIDDSYLFNYYLKFNIVSTMDSYEGGLKFR